MQQLIAPVNEATVKDELRDVVRTTVEDTLNALLEEEANNLIGADRYERTTNREAYRAGHYKRGLTTMSGQVTLRMPKLKGVKFTTSVIQRYKRRETAVENAIVEMYLAGVSTRRIQEMSQTLWGASVSATTVSALNNKAFKAVEKWRCRPLTCEYPYVFVDGIYLKRAWDGSFENISIMVAVGVNKEGYREVIGAAEGFTESTECWSEFLSWLKKRGLRGVKLITGDKSAAMAGAVGDIFPDAAYQRCTVHFYRNVMNKVPKSKRRQVAALLKTVHAQDTMGASLEVARDVADKLEAMRFKEAAKTVREGVGETLTYMKFPVEHWRRIRTNNVIERLNREVRRRTRAVGAFPAGKSALMLAAARLMRAGSGPWGESPWLAPPGFAQASRRCQA